MPALEVFRALVASQKGGEPRGIASVCSAQRVVLEAALLQGLRDGLPVLIESTVNQVNQLGGYTGMTPEGFRDFVGGIAEAAGFPRERLMLGGDHLGPFPWRAESAGAAMAKSRHLVTASVRAGYGKLHLDASMPLGGDERDARGGLDPRTIADRETELAAAAEAAFLEIRGALPGASPPVYVIGTEVPAPGGIVSAEDAVPVTRAEDLLETVSLCRVAFRRRGLDDAWTRVCAVVAQPGVEYGDRAVHVYDRARAARLCAAARGLPGIVLEGHSTDYQSPRHLRQMVEDGVAILKVGPALTFAMRECLFSLEGIEQELLTGEKADWRSGLSEALERAMLGDPAHWSSYYSGSEQEKRLARRFSFSDRSRYYWNVPEVRRATDTLLANLARTGIPLTLLHQFLPLSFEQVLEGSLDADPGWLLRESVRQVLERYSAAAGRVAR